MSKLPKRILIIGLGLMGGSIAEALSHNGYHVEAISLYEEEISFAKEKGFIQDGRTTFSKEYLASFPCFLFALYPSTLVKWMKEHVNDIAPNTLLTDVTGIKEPIIREILPLLKGKDIDFVFAHPMAGKARKGVGYASKDIFKGSNFLITPIPINKEENIRAIEELGRTLGSGQIVRVSPKEHDEMIAYVSQLTHIIAMALMNAKKETHLDEYTGDSFRDLTRIAEMNDEMWPELFIMNQATLLQQMDLFLDEMNKIRDAIAHASIDELRKMMQSSTAKREAFSSESKNL